MRGAVFLWRGIGLLSKPGIRRFVVIPLLINLLLFSGAFVWSYAWIGSWMAWVGAFLPVWLAWLQFILLPLLMAALVVVLVFFFTTVANLVASPFNALLAEAVEIHLTGKPVGPGFAWDRFIAGIPGMLMDEMGKIHYNISRSIPLLLLFLIPGVNVVASPLWLLFSAWMMAVQYTDYAMGNHGLSGSTMRARLRERRWLALGFGGAVLLLSATPILNLIAIPAAVAGSTVLWVEELAALPRDE